MRIRPRLRLARAAVLCALAAGFGASGSAEAQSLIEALSTTYNSNPDLLAARAILRQTDETLAQAVANWRPRVTLSMEYNKIESDSFSVLRTPSFVILNGRFTTLTVTQPIFRGGKTVADTKTAQANIQAQRATLADTEQNVLLTAVTTYADLVQNIAIADARRNNVRVLIQQLDATRERFRVGELTITDVSQAEARLEGARADLVQAEAQIRISEAGYQRVIGQKPGRLGEMPLIGGLPISEDEAISLSMDYGPRAVSAQYKISAATYAVNSAIGNLLPQINVVGVIQQQFDFQVPTDQYYTYGVRVQATIPIYQNGSEWSQVRQAKEVVAQRRNELDSARRAQAENVIRAWRQLDAARSRVTSFEAQVRANEVALNGVRQEALVGSRTTLDVLNAEQELLNSQVNLVQARHDVQVAYYGVLAGIGRLTARTMALPVEYYDEERYYNDVGSRWIGWGNPEQGPKPIPAPTTTTSGGFGSK
ncbi:MAG: TolC family outer membrane protein [Alphaproteobacteria bacterium]|nr:TolC family outer membrane protein [Alphaproteobacteria bacterium]MBV8412183.1 TolC family outer membrane protein [Alphaproteobacteria bacterium]